MRNPYANEPIWVLPAIVFTGVLAGGSLIFAAWARRYRRNWEEALEKVNTAADRAGF